MLRRAERARWRQDFPSVLRNGDLGELEAHPEYREAKAGNPDAALTLAAEMVRTALLDELRALAAHEGVSSPLIVPVIAEEAHGRNWIPLMAAEVIGYRLGWDVETDIVQASKVGRTGQGADYRLVHHPSFAGAVAPDRDYVILDDTLSMGGTLASLHGFIANRGGRVLAASAMTAHPGACQLAVTNKMLHRIDARHGAGMDALCEEILGHGLAYLTQGEAGHFRAAKSVEAMKERLLAQGPGVPASARLSEVELFLEALEGQQADEARRLSEQGWQAYGRRDVDGLRRCLEGVSRWSADRSLPPLLQQQIQLATSALELGEAGYAVSVERPANGEQQEASARHGRLPVRPAPGYPDA